jgi:hypothetical protein
MKLLVAGGSGYLESVLIPRPLDRGYEVDVVELFWFGNHLPSQHISTDCVFDGSKNSSYVEEDLPLPFERLREFEAGGGISRSNDHLAKTLLC